MRHMIIIVFIACCWMAVGCAAQVPLSQPTAGVATAAATGATAIPTIAAANSTTVSPTAASPTTKSGTLRFFDLVNLDVRDIPMLMALEELEAEGYKVEKSYVANSTLIADALSRGDADIGVFNDQTAWAAIGKGAPIRTIVQFTGGSFVVSAINEIKECKDLDGKRVGMATTTGTNPALLALYLKDKCGDAKPNYVVLPESAARTAAMVAGELDATVMPGEEFIKLDGQAPGKFHILIPLSKEYSDVQVDGVHVQAEWAKQHPELVHDFLTALLNANRKVVDNPQVLYDEAVKRLKLEPALAKKIADGYLELGIWDANGGLTEERLQNTLDFYTTSTGLQKGLTVADVADLTNLNAVLDEIGRK